MTNPSSKLNYDTSSSMMDLFTKYGKTNLFHIFCGIFGTLTGRFSGLLPALFLGLSIDLIFFEQSAPEFYPFSNTLNSLSPFEKLLLFSGIIALSFFIGAISLWIGDRGWNAFAQEVQHSIRTDAYDALQQLSMDFFEDSRTGELLSILNNDVNQLEDFLSTSFSDSLRLIVMVFGIGIILFLLNPELTIIAMSPVPLIAVLTYFFVKNIHPKYVSMRSSVGHLGSRLEDNLSGIEVIKTESTKPYELVRVSKSSFNYHRTNWATISTRIKFFPMIVLLLGAGFILTFSVGGIWVISGPPFGFKNSLTPGIFVTFIVYVQQFVWPIAQFGQIINVYQRAKASNNRIFTLLNSSPSITESNDAIELPPHVGHLSFNQVYFKYPSRNEYTLKNISFELNKGETLGIVGASGSGKSTIVKLLSRLYDVDKGSICIDGKNVKDITIHSLRNSLAYVSQETYLFSGSLRENITYGLTESTDKQLISATKTALIHDFILTLPDGYDTHLGERGINLSGGQRQRIALARALLKQSQIFVIDEGTRHMDTKTESIIQKQLSESVADKIKIIISHRISAVRHASIIIIIDNGEIVDIGSHKDLLNTSSIYSSLWKSQSEFYLT